MAGVGGWELKKKKIYSALCPPEDWVIRVDSLAGPGSGMASTTAESSTSVLPFGLAIALSKSNNRIKASCNENLTPHVGSVLRPPVFRNSLFLVAAAFSCQQNLLFHFQKWRGWQLQPLLWLCDQEFHDVTY